MEGKVRVLVRNGKRLNPPELVDVAAPREVPLKLRVPTDEEVDKADDARRAWARGRER
jgi:hypothetical protein